MEWRRQVEVEIERHREDVCVEFNIVKNVTQ